MTPEDPYRPQDLSHNPYAAPLAEDPERPFAPTLTGRTLNPWVSIWTQPRATIRQIVETDPRYMVLTIVLISGIAYGLSNAMGAQDNPAFQNANLSAGVLIVGGMFGGLIIAPLAWLLFSWLWHITAGWLGGTATLTEMRAAYAWGVYPSIVLIPAYLAVLIFTGSSLSPAIESRVLVTTGVLQLVVVFWRAIITYKCIGEVSHFSAWKGWGTAIFAWLLLVVPMIVIVFVGVAVVIAVSQ